MGMSRRNSCVLSNPGRLGGFLQSEERKEVAVQVLLGVGVRKQGLSKVIEV